VACGRGESPAFRHGSAPLLAPHRAPRVLRQERSPAGSAHSILSRFLRPRFSMFRSVVGRALLGGCTFRLLERRARDGCASGDTSTRCWRRDRFVAFLHDTSGGGSFKAPCLDARRAPSGRLSPLPTAPGPPSHLPKSSSTPRPPRASPFASPLAPADSARGAGIGTPTPTDGPGIGQGLGLQALGELAPSVARLGGRESKPVAGVPPVGASAV